MVDKTDYKELAKAFNRMRNPLMAGLMERPTLKPVQPKEEVTKEEPKKDETVTKSD